MRNNYDRLFVFDERQVLVEKHQPEASYLYIYASPQTSNKTNFKHAEYQKKIGISRAYINACNYRIIEEEKAEPNSLVPLKLLHFFRFAYRNNITVNQIYIYDVKLLSKRKVARDFILFYILHVLRATLYTKYGLFRSEDLNLRSKRLLNMLFDYELFSALLIGQSRVDTSLEQPLNDN